MGLDPARRRTDARRSHGTTRKPSPFHAVPRQLNRRRPMGQTQPRRVPWDSTLAGDVLTDEGPVGQHENGHPFHVVPRQTQPRRVPWDSTLAGDVLTEEGPMGLARKPSTFHVVPRDNSHVTSPVVRSPVRRASKTTPATRPHRDKHENRRVVPQERKRQRPPGQTQPRRVPWDSTLAGEVLTEEGPMGLARKPSPFHVVPRDDSPVISPLVRSPVGRASKTTPAHTPPPGQHENRHLFALSHGTTPTSRHLS